MRVTSVVQSSWKYFSVRKTIFAKMSPMDPLFVTDSHQALSRHYFLDKLKFILQLCGYDPTLYNGHSFRSGADQIRCSFQCW
jgi:site-specific recombinase XerD